MNEENIIICRCEDVTLKEIRELINEGFTTIEELKRIARVGMGPCQGKSCNSLIAREISKATGKPVDEILHQNLRPPFGGITFGEVVGGLNEE